MKCGHDLPARPSMHPGGGAAGGDGCRSGLLGGGLMTKLPEIIQQVRECQQSDFE
ncbi:MAG TPA: hypothetical protein PLB55_07950 [Prosthecobacter sp.]|nr:hypothetical protein [Prosthecobacter sp.]